jgi:uncharacterized membrane protein
LEEQPPVRDACHIASHPSDDRAHASIDSVQMNTRPQSLVDQLVGYVGLPRRAFAFALAVVCLLVLLLFVAIFAHGGLPVGGRWGLWKMGLEPAVIIYILGIYPPLHRRWTLAIDALRPLTNRPELVEQTHAVNRHGEWTALLLGAAFSVWVTNPLQFNGRWLLLYVFASNIVMFSLMALAIYDCLVRTRRLARIVRSGLQLDLFDRRSFTPLARWGQSVSLTFVGGTCLSLLFQSYETLYTVQSLVIYSIMVVVSLTLFFTSIWSIHGALVAAQQRELAVIHEHWSRARSELKRKLAEGAASEPAGLYEPIVVLGAYETQILAASTWPFNPKIVKELVASLVAPILIYGLKIAVGLAGST